MGVDWPWLVGALRRGRHVDVWSMGRFLPLQILRGYTLLTAGEHSQPQPMAAIFTP